MMPDTEFLRKVASMSMDGIYVYDNELRTNVYINDRYTEILGYTREDINALTEGALVELFHPEDRDTVLAHMDKVNMDERGKAYELHYRFRHKDGHWVWCHSRDAVFARGADGKCTQFIGSFIDVTQMMESENRARDLGILMQAMLENDTTAHMVLDRDYNLHVLNTAAKDLLNIRPATLPTKLARPLLFAEKEALSPVSDPIEAALGGTRFEDETFALYPGEDQPLKYVRLSSIPLQGTTGEKVMITIRDVTQEEYSRQQRERSERLDALGQLTGGIAHDFNNVLAAILPTVQVAQRLTEDPQLQKLLAIIESSTNRGSQLAGRLLAFARRQPVLEEDVDVGAMLETLSDLAQSTVGRQVALNYEPLSRPLKVRCDASQLENALLNLIINARDAIVESGKGSQITLLCRTCDPLDQSGERVEFTVTDDGPGMAEAVKMRAFDPFFTTRANTSGTGLGLSTVYGFAKQAGGDVSLYSEQSIGTTVRLTLPSVTLELEEEQTETEPVLPDHNRWISGQQASVLVAEDEPDLLQSVVEFLKLLDFNPIPALNAELAIAELAKREDIAILLTDIMMPGGMNGFELAMAAQELQPDLTVIYMSGYTGFINDGRRQVEGAFLQKPCDVDSLSKALSDAMRARMISAG